eukprot:CAMPEP_0175011866 /NCGR_PEP_ID=MMETSP0005-20121125/8952_1 /TAXON_ID=420556 /ORGANISM="Ochromonas sp., Strain CCMP1393" /LENGTH=45 /DNA_ID= /DNA_START= /DNA_END= /DNA_ORIENTATION=
MGNELSRCVAENVVVVEAASSISDRKVSVAHRTIATEVSFLHSIV